ncbi:MAG: flavin reductase [Peptococcaceae bacterium]|nr:flavin reductase [Peptococcaceae bacterium]
MNESQEGSEKNEAPTWRCTVCGYIHKGENPPETCLVCGVDASNFERISESKPVQAAENIPPEKLSPEEAIKKAIRSLSYGLFIITASFEGKDNGQTANTCFQITADPVQVAIGINKNNYTHELISKSGKFGVSILDQNGRALAGNFGYRSGREVDKFDGIKAHRGTSGVMLPDEVLATLEAEVVNSMDTGTHTLFLGKVTAAEVLGNGEPMTYAFFRSKK